MSADDDAVPRRDAPAACSGAAVEPSEELDADRTDESFLSEDLSSPLEARAAPGASGSHLPPQRAWLGSQVDNGSTATIDSAVDSGNRTAGNVSRLRSLRPDPASGNAASAVESVRRLHHMLHTLSTELLRPGSGIRQSEGGTDSTTDVRQDDARAVAGYATTATTTTTTTAAVTTATAATATAAGGSVGGHDDEGDDDDVVVGVGDGDDAGDGDGDDDGKAAEDGGTNDEAGDDDNDDDECDDDDNDDDDDDDDGDDIHADQVGSGEAAPVSAPSVSTTTPGGQETDAVAPNVMAEVTHLYNELGKLEHELGPGAGGPASEEVQARLETLTKYIEHMLQRSTVRP